MHPDVADDIDAAPAHPRPISTFFSSARISSSLASPSTVKKSSMRHCSAPDKPAAHRSRRCERGDRVWTQRFRFERDQLDRFLQGERDHAGSEGTAAGGTGRCARDISGVSRAISVG
jgi:hypothetical protein